MAISIQSFSPLKSTITNYYLHSDRYTVAELTSYGTEYYTKPELMFTDTNDTLYCMVFRRRYGSTTKLDLVKYSKMSGFNNGTSNRDYRLDLSNQIKIVHPKVEFEAVYSSYVKKMEYYQNSADIYVVIASTDILNDATYMSHLTTESNGNKYITYSNFISYSPSNVVFKDNWFFKDSNDQFVFLQQDTSTIYSNSWYLIHVKSTLTTPNNYISNIVVKDASSATIYSSPSSILATTKDYAVGLIWIPSNAATLQFTTNYWNGSTTIVTNYTRNVIAECPTNQYFYYGTRDYFTSLHCFGKREEINTIEKTTAKIGGVDRVLKLLNKKSYNQNVGFKLDNTKVFELSLAPYLIEYDSVYSLVKKWNIANSTFEGYNTKRYGEKNFVLNLVQASDEERKTTFDIDFYS